MQFKLPIQYNKHCKQIINEPQVQEHYMVGMHMIDGIDYYIHALGNSSHMHMIDEIRKYYTTDVSFLTDTQQWILKLKHVHIDNKRLFTTIYPLESNWTHHLGLNDNSIAMQCVALYQILIPIYHAISLLFTLSSKDTMSFVVHLMIAVLSILKSHNCITAVNDKRCIVNKNMEIIEQNISIAKQVLSQLKNVKSYALFKNNLKRQLNKLKSLKRQVESYNLDSWMSIGSILSMYNVICSNHELLYYFNDLREYLHIMSELSRNEDLKFATFLTEEKAKEQDNMVIDKLHICNNQYVDVKMHNNNMIITGPDGTGKFTIASAICRNLVFSQQFGCGFYQHAKFVPYDEFHINNCNLSTVSHVNVNFDENIVSCNAVAKHICEHPEKRHFYLLTNPFNKQHNCNAELKKVDESVVIASFISFFVKQTNTNFIVTSSNNDITKLLKHTNGLQWVHVGDNFQLQSGVRNVPTLLPNDNTIHALNELNCLNEIVQLVDSFQTMK